MSTNIPRHPGQVSDAEKSFLSIFGGMKPPDHDQRITHELSEEQQKNLARYRDELPGRPKEKSEIDLIIEILFENRFPNVKKENHERNKNIIKNIALRSKEFQEAIRILLDNLDKPKVVAEFETCSHAFFRGILYGQFEIMQIAREAFHTVFAMPKTDFNQLTNQEERDENLFQKPLETAREQSDKPIERFADKFILELEKELMEKSAGIKGLVAKNFDFEFSINLGDFWNEVNQKGIPKEAKKKPIDESYLKDLLNLFGSIDGLENTKADAEKTPQRKQFLSRMFELEETQSRRTDKKVLSNLKGEIRSLTKNLENARAELKKTTIVQITKKSAREKRVKETTEAKNNFLQENREFFQKLMFFIRGAIHTLSSLDGGNTDSDFYRAANGRSSFRGCVEIKDLTDSKVWGQGWKNFLSRAAERELFSAIEQKATKLCKKLEETGIIKKNEEGIKIKKDGDEVTITLNNVYLKNSAEFQSAKKRLLEASPEAGEVISRNPTIVSIFSYFWSRGGIVEAQIDRLSKDQKFIAAVNRLLEIDPIYQQRLLGLFSSLENVDSIKFDKAFLGVIRENAENEEFFKFAEEALSQAVVGSSVKGFLAGWLKKIKEEKSSEK